MPIDLNHIFARQVQNTQLSQNSHVRNSTPIGDQVNDTSLSGKADELKQLLSNYDLRNITPNQLANLGGELYRRGEISDNAVGAMMGTMAEIDGTDPNKPIDAIEHFEKMLSIVSNAISGGEQGLGFAQDYQNEALHTIYNLDSAIHSIRGGISFHELA